MSKLKILNLYAGIGGNRKLWDKIPNIQVTAVEINNNIAKVYQKFFPNDQIVVTDAHKYLLKYYKEYDFIWSSPPCQTHSDIRRCGVHRNLYDAVFPDTKLWQEIVFLKHFAQCEWVVENVKPYYKLFIPYNYKFDRHLFWCNFYIYPNIIFPERKQKHDKITTKDTIYGFNLSSYKIQNKRQILRNLVNPEIGYYILQSALKDKNKIGIFDN